MSIDSATRFRESVENFERLSSTSAKIVVSQRYMLPEDSNRSFDLPNLSQMSEQLMPDLTTGEEDEDVEVQMKVDAMLPEQRDAFILAKSSCCKRGLVRIPALIVTLVIELIVAFVLAQYAQSDLFRRYPLLISFQPVISAISGNVGLQSSSINVRAIAVGLVKRSDSMFHTVCEEARVGVLISLIMGAILGVIALVWYTPVVTTGEGHTTHGAFVFGIAICIGLMISSLLATVSGTLAPLLFSKCGLDPTAMSGPMETAVQDVVGGTLLLAFSSWILSHYGDYGADCPGGDLGACMNMCVHQVNSTINMHCMNNCIALDASGIC